MRLDKLGGAVTSAGPADQLDVRRRGPVVESRKYRNDIDGLRAVAVIAVILFHYDIFPSYIRGGFIGVDVFFVISGYLITGIIFHGIDDGTYTVISFYNRRIRRIFPALFAVFCFCILAAFIFYFPFEALATGRSIVASTFFVSNILFYFRSGYFNPDSETDPLLHTWSLSVEEQFYLAFPIVVFLIKKFSIRQRICIIGILLLASLLYSAYVVRTDMSAAFYLPQFRAWELLFGSMLALEAVPPISRQWLCEIVAAAGLALLCASLFLITRESLFPGPVALGPCIGTAAIIYSGSAFPTYVARLLSFRPIQFIGLISYSLYLWHWPVIVYFEVFHKPDEYEKSALVAISIILAAISWKFVEMPFRRFPYKLSAKGTLLAGGAAMALATIVALLLAPAVAGFWKYPARAIEVASYAKIDESNMRAGTCFLTTTFRADYNTQFKNDCLSMMPDRPNVLIVGDSHAAHLWSGLQSTYPNINFLQGTASGCKPLYRGKGTRYCTDTMNYVLDQFVSTNHLDGIIIAARWELSDLPRLISTVKELSKFAKRVIVFGPIVEYDRSLPRILARSIVSNQSPSEMAALHRLSGPNDLDKTFESALHKEGIEYFSTYQAICPSDCAIWADVNVPLQFDYGHLTKEGSAYLARRFSKTLLSDVIH
jgi:peptidoglycan/LPS O-acetylase OafA/YrhL